MSIKHLIAGLLCTAAAAVAIPATANASASMELKAGGVVERIATRHYPNYYFIASCDQYSSRRFWCDVSGQSGDCYRLGHASVRRTTTRTGWTWWVTLRGLSQECF